nr:lamin tail domain-containing protein [Hyalangium versicolor]
MGTSAAKVRITDTSNSTVTDTSNAAFTIVAASVTVTSPNGGESWVGGTSQNITWTSTGVTNVKLEYTANGTTWTTIVSSVAAGSGVYAWTVPNVSSGVAMVRVSDASNATISDTSDAAFAITPGGSGNPAAVFINEALINELGSDVNGEFIELINSGTSAVDLSGWTISDALSVRHTFAGGTMLDPGKAIVVFGGASAIPPTLTNAVAASTGQLNLSNSGDTVTVKDSTGTVVEAITFPSGTLTQDGISANRNPDATSGAAFAAHTSVVSGVKTSPGTRANGSAF